MSKNGVVISAGYDNSLPAIALAGFLTKKGLNVKGCIVVSPFSIKRLRAYVKRSGIRDLLRRSSRLTADHQRTNRSEGPLISFLKSEQIEHKSLKAWSKDHKADYLTVKQINSRKAAEFLKTQNPDWLIYSGGGILRNPILTLMDGKILNAHQGPLPETRGMNAAEWSVLMELKTESTIHLIDEGIDTGNILLRKPYTIEPEDDRQSIREKAILSGIRGLLEVVSDPDSDRIQPESNSGRYRQCYTLSGVMSKIFELKLSKRNSRN